MLQTLRQSPNKLLQFFKHGAFLDQIDSHTEPDAALTLLLNASDDLLNNEEKELVRAVLNGYRGLRKRADVTTATIDDFYQSAVALYQSFGLSIAEEHEESNKRDETRAKKALRARKLQESGEESAGAAAANAGFDGVQENVEAAEAAKPMSKQAKKNAKEKERKKRKKVEKESKEQGVGGEE